MKKLDGTSKDIIADNISKLKQLFPQAFSENKIDFDALKQLLGEYIDDNNERYDFKWHGKNKSGKLAATQSTGTLRPCKDESVNWDKSENLFIEGDNLEVLKLLQKSYHKKVKMIYIDPPYNTGKDFVYKDNFKDNIKNYKAITGQTSDDGRNLSSNPETSGRYHTDWLNMMYPRLLLAKNLLRDDGVIFISIDDNEVANLRKICDEIFGEENFVAELIWQKKTGASDSKNISTITEYILLYSRHIDIEVFTKNQKSYDLTRYKLKDDFFTKRGPYYIDNLDRGGLQYSDSLNFGIKCPDGTITYPNGRIKFKNDGWIWKWSKLKIEWARKNKFIEFKKSTKKSSGWSICYKNYLYVDNENNLIDRAAPHKNLINTILNTSSALIMKELFGNKVFQYSKPMDLVKLLVSFLKIKENEIILDFFSGSATTAHAVMQLNAEDKSNRKYIMVQLPEPCDEKSEAYKAGYKNIADIGKERIRRAASKIQTENLDYKGDLGFKVFKLDSTNIKPWDVDFDINEQDLSDRIDNIKPERSTEDILYEILLKYGLDLTVPIEEHNILGTKLFNIGSGTLIICLEKNISLELVEEIVKLKAKYQPETMRVVFQDSCFTDCVIKTNAVQILQQAGITDVKSL